MVFGRGKNMSKVKELEEKLANVGYKSNKEINYALLMALTCEKPLLIEGDPGVGKTALAQATADVLWTSADPTADVRRANRRPCNVRLRLPEAASCS